MRVGSIVLVVSLMSMIAAHARGDALYLVGGGGSFTSSASNDSETDKKGTIVRSGLMREESLDDFDLTLALGGASISVHGDNDVREQDLTQRSFLYDLACYWRLPWAGIGVGAGLDGMVGKGAHLNHASPDSVQGALFVSPRVKITWPVGPVDLFGSLQYGISMNLPSSRASMAMAMLGVGLPIGGGNTALSIVSQDVTPSIAAAEKSPLPPANKPVVLDARTILFDDDFAKMNAASERLLTELGTFLTAQNGKWQSLRITSHLVGLEDPEHNAKLAEERVVSVRDPLVKAGVHQDKIQVQVKQAKERSRRVELLLVGQDEVVSGMSAIVTKTGGEK